MASSRVVTPELLRAILEQYELHPGGPHGIAHWARVTENGRRLAERTGASRDVVELFAVFHDACRENDGDDPGHGARGAMLAERLRGSGFDLSDEDFAHLRIACARHTDGKTDGDVTVRTCWDADRLDLGRVGIRPRSRYLCTGAGRDSRTREWANRRALGAKIPRLIRTEWRVSPAGSPLFRGFLGP